MQKMKKDNYDFVQSSQYADSKLFLCSKLPLG